MLVENQYAKAGTHHPSFSISIRQCLIIGFERAFENRKRANPKSENAHMKKKKKTRKKNKKRAFEKPDARKKKSGVTTQTDSPRFFRGSSVGTPVRGVYFFFVVFGFRHPGGFETTTCTRVPQTSRLGKPPRRSWHI